MASTGYRQLSESQSSLVSDGSVSQCGSGHADLTEDELTGSTGNNRLAGHGVMLYQNKARYTALGKTGIRELEPETDAPGYGLRDPTAPGYEMQQTYVRMGLVSNKRKPLSKINVIIGGLLIAAVILVAFTFIYVFLVLPSEKGHVIFSDGKAHGDDISRIKLLGDYVAYTTCGIVRGFPESGATVFQGIPYAAPPTGSRRWKQPTPISPASGTCWSNILNATRYGSVCAQPRFGDVTKMDGHEDCLYLNVWTPSLNPKELHPVMVWIHSGDFVYGSGHMPGMSPTASLSVTTQTVYVSFNYRLGAFGFLALDELREGQEKSAGNYGLMDQQMALTWVRENIRYFGGNENLITVFGHGSGATSIQALMLSPKSSGLFHKAWLTSPVSVLNKTLDQACHDNRKFLANSGCSSLECLRKLSSYQVMTSSPWPLEPMWTLDQIFHVPAASQFRNGLAIFDGHVVKSASITNGPQGPVVPVIFGTSYFDLSSLKSEDKYIGLTWGEYDTILDTYLSDFGYQALNQIKTLYSHDFKIAYSGPAKFPPLPSAQLAHMLGDIRSICPVRIIAKDFAYLNRRTSPVYMYVGEIYPTHKVKLASEPQNTFVGWDVAVFFNSFRELDYVEGQGDVNFQNVIREQVLSFVKDGRPDASRWQTVDVNTGVIGTDVTVAPVDEEYFEKCELWRKLGFFNYTWQAPE